MAKDLPSIHPLRLGLEIVAKKEFDTLMMTTTTNMITIIAHNSMKRLAAEEESGNSKHTPDLPTIDELMLLVIN